MDVTFSEQSRPTGTEMSEAGTSSDSKSFPDHATPLKASLSWAVYEVITLKTGIPVMLYYDPKTGRRIKESELPEGWTCSYEEAVETAEACWWYDGVAFLLTHEDPYHVTVVKGAGGPYRDGPRSVWGEYAREVLKEVLEEQNTLAVFTPSGKDVYLVGKSERPKGRYKKFSSGPVNMYSYDGGWDDKQRKFTPRFYPYSGKAVSDFDRPIADVQGWVDEYVPERVSKKPIESPLIMVEDKQAEVKPIADIPPNVAPVVSRMRAGTWTYELGWDDEDRFTPDRPARSPKNGEKILWGPENFQLTKDLWGSYREAYGSFEGDERLQGIFLLIEPYKKFEIDGKEYYPVFFDLDDCRNPETGEVDPWAMEIVEQLGTYAEPSPSGKGIRCVGLVGAPKERMRNVFHTPNGKVFVPPKDKEDGYHRVEIYGGGVGGRHLISFTGRPLEGYDRPLAEVRKWVDENVPLHEQLEDTAVEPEPLALSDEELVARMLSSKDGDLIERFMRGDETLWKGENKKYETRNEADLGFCRKLAFWTNGDKERVKRILLSSKMKRGKWDRESYLDTTIDLAVNYCKGEFLASQDERMREFLENCTKVWMGLKDPKERLPLGALLLKASDYGTYTRKGFKVEAHGMYHKMPDSGLWFFCAHRDLGLLLGEDDVRAVNKIRQPILKKGAVLKISEGKGPKGTLYLIPEETIEDLLSRSPDEVRDTHPHTPNFFVSFYVGKDEEPSPERTLHQKILWTKSSRNGRPGLHSKQKLILELVLYGMRNLSDISSFLGMRKDNLKRTIAPLLALGILKPEGDDLKIPENFEEALHRVFVESGGAKALEAAKEKFRKERKEYHEDGKQANTHRSEERIKAALLGNLAWSELNEWEENQAGFRLFEALRDPAS